MIYLDEIPKFRRNDENIRCEVHLAELLKLLIIHVDFLRRRIERIVAKRTIKLKIYNCISQEQQRIQTNNILLLLKPKEISFKDEKCSTNLLWVNMCFMILEKRSVPVPLQKW